MRKFFTVCLLFFSFQHIVSAQLLSPINYGNSKYYPFIQIGGVPNYIAVGLEFEKKNGPLGLLVSVPFVYATSKSIPPDFFPFSGRKSGIIGSASNPLMDNAWIPTASITYQAMLFQKSPIKLGAGINMTIYNKAIFYPHYFTYQGFSLGAPSPIIVYSIDHRKIYSPGLTLSGSIRPFQKRFRSINVFAQANINGHWTFGTLGIQLNIRKFKDDTI